MNIVVCATSFLQCVQVQRSVVLGATVHAWGVTRSRSRPWSSHWRCRTHACIQAPAGRHGLGAHLVSSAVMCAPLCSRWRRRREDTFKSRRRRQVGACGQPQVAQAHTQCATSRRGAAQGRRAGHWQPCAPIRILAPLFLGREHVVQTLLDNREPVSMYCEPRGAARSALQRRRRPRVLAASVHHRGRPQCSDKGSGHSGAMPAATIVQSRQSVTLVLDTPSARAEGYRPLVRYTNAYSVPEHE